MQQSMNRGWVKHIRASVTVFAIVTACAIFPAVSFAQTTTTGSINGTVTDSTGALVPNRSVTVANTANDATLHLTSNGEGHFTAPFLAPDTYEVSATAPGLRSTRTTVPILVGQQSAITLTLTPEASTQTVQVSPNDVPLVDTQSSNTTTTFTTSQFQNLPAPGGDITTIAYTVPGVVVGAGTVGFGAISSDGLPGLSNMVILNGIDYNLSLYGGVNFSGSSNLTLGQVGAQAYNVLNHVNFGLPGNNASSSNTLGVISTDIGPPTSPCGSSQQASIVSGRILVVQGRLVF